MSTTYDIIRDPTTGEPLMSVCTRGPLTDEEKNALAALQLYRRRRERTPQQQAWLDEFLRPHLPDREDTWSAADEDASWLAEDDKARRREDR